MIGIVLLAVAAGWLSMSGGKPAVRPALVLDGKDASRLVVGSDVKVGQWASPDLYPREVRNSGVNVRFMYTVTFKPGVELKAPAKLRLPAPFGMVVPAEKPTGPGALQVCEFLPEGRIWTPRSAEWVGTADTLFETSIMTPGYYGLVEIIGPQALPTLKDEEKDKPKAKPEPETPAGEGKPVGPDPSKYRFAPVMRRMASGEWQEVADFRLCITPERETLRIDDVPVVSLWGPPPGFLSGTQTAQWYMSEEDALSDIPEEVRLLSDKDAFRFRIPQSVMPGTHTIVFRIVDTVSDEMLGVICEAKITVTIAGE